ncbi:MAG: tetratricopeptide repeat protein [candidate division FCPU426 bacterium]
MTASPSASPTPAWTWPAKLFAASLVVLAFGLLLQPLGDPDVYIHLRDGRYWVQKHLHAGPEPFAYTVPDKQIEKVEVLFRIGIYLVYRLGGYPLLIILKALAMTAALWLLAALVYRRWPNLAVVSLLLAVAMLAPMTRIMPERPYVVTYLLLPWVMLVLERFRGGTSSSARRDLWLLPLLVVPWVNLHPGFIVMFGFIGAHLLEEAWEYWRAPGAAGKQRLLHLAAVLAVAALAGALNPLGFGIYRFVFETTASRDFMRFLTEWAPPVWSEQPLFFILLAVTWLAQLAAWRRTRLADWLPLLAFSYLALKSYRNLPLFFFAALPPLAANLRWLAGKLPWRAALSAASRRLALFAGAGLAAVLIALSAVTGFSFRLGLIPNLYPTHGLPWLLKHPLHGRILAHDIWGGYIGWISQGGVQVFIDGRFPLFGEKLYADYRKMIWGDPQECLALLDRYDIQGLLVSPKNEIRMFQQIWKSGQWVLVYWDDDCLIYARRSQGNLPVILSFGYTAIDPKKNPFFHPQKPEQALAEAQRAAEIAPDSVLPLFFTGQLQLQLGRLQEARLAFEQVLRRAPRHAGAWFQLGMIAREDKQWQEAERRLRRAYGYETSPPWRGRISYFLADTLKNDPGRRSEALAWARRSRALLPDWEPAATLLKELEP